MPIYEFIAPNGDTVEAVVPMGTNRIKRDGVCYEKAQCPQAISITGRMAAPTTSDLMKDGYKREEDRGWRSRYSKNQVKKAWGI